MSEHNSFKSEVKRINGYLKEVVTFFDASGKPISSTMNPLMVELKPRDVLQIFVGSLVFAAPLSMTEEIWNLSETVPLHKIKLMLALSLTTVFLFIFFNYYRMRLKGNVINLVKRVLATYIITLSSAVMMLYLIDKLPLDNTLVAMKRVIIIGFPALFGATISDFLK